MNLLLFRENELHSPLLRSDLRFDHISKILKAKVGDILEGGIINGSRGKIRIDSMDKQALHFTFIASSEKQENLSSLTLIIGCPRPPTARRMIKDLCSMGVGRLIFTDTELNEKSYLRAKLWRDELYKKALIEGAMQGKSTLIPQLDRFYSLRKALESLRGGECRMVPDLTDGTNLLNLLNNSVGVMKGAVLAIGPERGWTDRERKILLDAGFAPVTLGSRVMRTETAAAVAAGAVLLHLKKS